MDLAVYAESSSSSSYVTTMAVLIILPVILQTVINLTMLSLGGQQEHAKNRTVLY